MQQGSSHGTAMRGSIFNDLGYCGAVLAERAAVYAGEV